MAVVVVVVLVVVVVAGCCGCCGCFLRRDVYGHKSSRLIGITTRDSTP